MLDFLDLPVNETVSDHFASRLPPRLQKLYATVFRCLAHREGWPLVWPCFGRKEKLPLRSKAKRALLGGEKNEALHINEVGWLLDERSYARVRKAISDAEIEFKVLDLADLEQLPPAKRVFFISNIEGSSKFMQEDALESLRLRLAGRDGSSSDHNGCGTLL